MPINGGDMMKKNVILLLSICFCLTFLISACRGETDTQLESSYSDETSENATSEPDKVVSITINPDSVYDPESDYDYMFREVSNGSCAARSDKGYYFINKEIIYFSDAGKISPIPLCNRINCTHDGDGCNAYIGDQEQMNISYCDGYVYTVIADIISSTEMSPKLLRIAADGSSKDVVLDDMAITGCIVFHRGYGYYASSDYDISSEDVISHTRLMRLDLSDYSQDVIYETDGEISWIMAYGDYLYINVSKRLDKGEEICEFDERYYYTSTGDIDFKEAPLPDGTSQAVMSFSNGKIILSLMFDDLSGFAWLTEPDERDNVIYISDLDFTDMTEWNTKKEHISMGTDGNLIYEDNFVRFLYGLDESRSLEISDKDHNKITTVDLPVSYNSSARYGDENYYFYLDESGESLYYLDKRTLSSDTVELTSVF